MFSSQCSSAWQHKYVASHICASFDSFSPQCTATYSMFKYEIQRIVIEDESGDTALVHNTNLTAAVYLTIVFCAFVATLFGADFFFLLFWPARIYPRWYNTTRQALAVGITAGVGAAAVMSTVCSYITFCFYVTDWAWTDRRSHRAWVYNGRVCRAGQGIYHIFLHASHECVPLSSSPSSLTCVRSSLPYLGCQRCLCCASLDWIRIYATFVSCCTSVLSFFFERGRSFRTILMFMVITHDNDKAIRAQIVLAMPDSTSLKEVPTGDKEC
jgi:hypothetical protein